MTTKMYVGPQELLKERRGELEEVFEKWVSKNSKYRFISNLDKRGLIMVLVRKSKEKKE